MKEFSSVISVYPLSEITIEDPTPWLNDVHGSHFFQADDFVFDIPRQETEAGVIFDATKEFIITTPSDSDVQTFKYPVKSIMVVKDTDGNKYSIGTTNIPAKVHVVKGLQKSRLYVTAMLLQSPF